MPRRKPPVSEIQLAANRANAANSTGPRTAEGKARSTQNARKHGFTASTFAVVRLEDLHEVEHLRDDLIAVYQPVNSQKLFASSASPSPSRLSSAPRNRGIRKAQSPAARITKRTHSRPQP